MLRSALLRGLAALDRRLARGGPRAARLRAMLARAAHWLRRGRATAPYPRRKAFGTAGMAPDFFSGEESSSRPASPWGPGFRGTWQSSPPNDGAPPPDAIAERVTAMRRAAVFDLFDQARLEIVPGNFWPYAAREPSIDRALAAFLGDLGLKVEAIRAGNRRALKKANDLFELLAQIGPAFTRLKPAARGRLQRALLSGDYAAVRSAAETVAVYERILRMEDRWAAELRIPAFRAFLEQVASALDDPLQSSAEDAREAQAAADVLAELMQRFDHAMRHFAAVKACLDDAGYSSSPAAGKITRDLAFAHRVLEEIGAAPLDPAEVRALLDALEAALERLARAARKGGSGGASGGAGRGSDPGASAPPREWEIALVFFGFDSHDSPSFAEIRKRYRELMKKAHPDTGGSDAEAKEVNTHFDVLRARFGGK